MYRTLKILTLVALVSSKVEILSEGRSSSSSTKPKGKGMRVNLERKKSESYTLRAAKISEKDFAAMRNGAQKSSWFDFDGKDSEFMDEIKTFVKSLSNDLFTHKEHKQIDRLSDISHLQ